MATVRHARQQALLVLIQNSGRLHVVEADSQPLHLHQLCRDTSSVKTGKRRTRGLCEGLGCVVYSRLAARLLGLPHTNVVRPGVGSTYRSRGPAQTHTVQQEARPGYVFGVGALLRQHTCSANIMSASSSVYARYAGDQISQRQ